jgi:hypothetical protein
MLNRSDLITLVGAIFMVEQNLIRSDSDAKELFDNAFNGAERWVDHCLKRVSNES